MAPETLGLRVFNAQRAAPDRARNQAAWLARDPQASLLVLTEVGLGTGGDALVGELSDLGFPYWHALPVDGRDFRSVLMSRDRLDPCYVGLDFLPHRAPAALLHKKNHAPIGIWGLYVPSRGPKQRRNQDKRAFQEAVTTALPNVMENFGAVSMIVAGDLNVVEPDHVPAHRVFGRWEYDFYDSFRQAGLTDVFGSAPAHERGHSWFSRTGNGFRFDHAFTNTPLSVLTRSYDQSPRELRLSDHACLQVSFDLTCDSADTLKGIPA